MSVCVCVCVVGRSRLTSEEEVRKSSGGGGAMEMGNRLVGCLIWREAGSCRPGGWGLPA